MVRTEKKLFLKHFWWRFHYQVQKTVHGNSSISTPLKLAACSEQHPKPTWWEVNSAKLNQTTASPGHQNFTTSCSSLKSTELQLTDAQLVKMKQVNSCVCSLWNMKFSELLQKHSSSPPPQQSSKEIVGKRLNCASNPHSQHLPQITMTPLILNKVTSRLYCILDCLVLRGKASDQEACTHHSHLYLHHTDPQHAEQLISHHVSYQNEYGQYHLLTL